MRLYVFRSAFLRRAHFRLNLRLSCRIGRATGELSAQLFDDSLGKLSLDGEDILQITGVIFRPLLFTGVGLSETCCDAQTSPALRTLPSTKWATPSFCPISWAVAFLSLNENADVRAATCIPGIFCSTIKSSSLTPSEKYSLPLSSLRLTKGRTATDF